MNCDFSSQTYSVKIDSIVLVSFTLLMGNTISMVNIRIVNFTVSYFMDFNCCSVAVDNSCCYLVAVTAMADNTIISLKTDSDKSTAVSSSTLMALFTLRRDSMVDSADNILLVDIVGWNFFTDLVVGNCLVVVVADQINYACWIKWNFIDMDSSLVNTN